MENGSEIKGESSGLNYAYQQALDKTAIVTIIDLEGRLTYVNDNFCEISQYSPEELIGEECFFLEWGQQDSVFFEDRRDTIQREGVWTGQVKNKAKSGDFYWTQSTMVPLLDKAQQPSQYLSFGLDITEQKLKEHQLEESKHRLNIVANNFPNGSVGLIDKDLTVLFAGGSGYEEVGFRAEEIIGKPLETVVSASTYAFIKEHLPRILEGEMISHEIHGENSYYSHTYKPVYDAHGISFGFILVATNISESQDNIRALKRKNEMFAIGEELARIGSWESFGSAMEIYFSTNTLKLLGQDTSRNRWSFDEIFPWIHPDEIENVFKSFQVMVDEKLPGIQEFRVIKPDGEERVFQSSSKMEMDDEGKELRKFGVVIDITEKRKKEQELLESTEILRNIADSIPGLVMRYVEAENKKAEIQYVSKGAELLWGIAKEQIISDVDIVWNRVHPEDLTDFLESFTRSRETVSVWEREFRIIMDDGKIKWISAIGTPQKVLGDRMRWDILALDITDKKFAEDKLVNNLQIMTLQNTQLIDFCNIVSHNLRSPLVNLAVLIEFVEESEDEEERQTYLEKLKPVIDGLKETFDELVESIQIQQDHQLKSEDLIFQECFDKVIRSFEGQIAQSHATIEIDFSQAPFVRYPSKYMVSILHNLLSNALKYRSPDRSLQLTVKTEKVRDKILLSFTDNGLGIDLQKYGQKIFKIRQVFHRHPDAKGFGLYITRTQLEAMKDKIWVESIPEKGSTFYVEFNKQ